MTGPCPGIVLCIGLGPDDVAEVARALAGRAMLVTAPDTAAGRTAVLTAVGLAALDGSADAEPAPPPVALPARHRVIAHGPLAIDVDRREALWHDRVLDLPARSFDLLVTLAEDPGRTWSFADLTLRVWRRDYLGDTDAVISAVKRLRSHIACPAPGLRVESVRGIGFRLRGVQGPKPVVVARQRPASIEGDRQAESAIAVG